MQKATLFRFVIAMMIVSSFVSMPLRAEMLPSDLNADETVDIQDLFIMVNWWLEDDCQQIFDCFGADMTGPQGSPDGTVNLFDFTAFSTHWLESIPQE